MLFLKYYDKIMTQRQNTLTHSSNIAIARSLKIFTKERRK